MSRRNPLCWLALIILVYVVWGPFLAIYPPDLQQRDFPFVPPMRLHWTASGLTFPFSYCGLKQDGDGFHEDCTTASRLQWRLGRRLFQPDDKHPFFLLGSDALGRDQFSRLIEGGRLTLAVGAAAAAVAVFIGMLVGMCAGYGAARLDTIVTAATTIVLTCPWIYLLLAIRSALPLSLPPETAVITVMAVCAVVGWPRSALLFRALVKSARRSEYVLLSRSFGAGWWHVFRVHLMPQLRHAALAQFTSLAPQFVLAEATLSFLGLGVQEPGVSWGILLSGLRDASVLLSHAWMALPCIPIAGMFFILQWAARMLQYTDES